MSLRDALLKAGAVNKKAVQKTERELKQQRKQHQGARERKSEVEAREKAEAAQREQDRLARAREAIARRESMAELSERARNARGVRVRQLLAAHGIEPQHGEVRFFVPSLDRTHLVRLELSWGLARALREGRMAVAAVERAYSDDPDYRVVNRLIAERVLSVDPRFIVFHNAEPPDDEAERLLLDEVLPAAPIEADDLLAAFERRRRQAG